MDFIASSDGDIDISAGDGSWIREAYPQLAIAAKSGRKIRLILAPSSDTSRSAIADISVSVGSLGVVAMAERSARPHWTAIRGAGAVLVDAGSAFLFDKDERGLVHLLARAFNDIWAQSIVVNEAVGSPTVSEVPVHRFLKALKSGVHQYADADLTVESIRPRDTRPLTPYIESFKLNRLRNLGLLSLPDALPPVAKIGASPWLTALPIVESGDDGLVVIDGTHRMFDAQDKNAPMEVIVARHVRTGLPARPLDDWSQCRVGFTKVPRDERYSGFREESFRDIRGATEALGRAL